MSELKMKPALYRQIKQAIQGKLSGKQAAWGHTPQQVRDWYKSEGVKEESFHWALLHSLSPEIRYYEIQPELNDDLDVTPALAQIANEIGVSY